MIDKKLYLNIEKKYGHYASWAIWAKQGDKPKSNVGDLSIFDIEKNPKLVELLNPNIIMVGLNISRPIEYKFGDFHDKRPQSQDYKIRYAFKETKFWGAYMTDIIKDFEQLIAGNVATYLNKNKNFELENINIFRNELNDIGADNPLIIAFGNHSFNILNKHFKNDFQIVKVPHYSMHISKENYRKVVAEILKDI